MISQFTMFNISGLEFKSGNIYKIVGFILVFIMTFFMVSCDITDETSSDELSEVYEYHFEESDFGWEPFFTGYSVGRGDDMELTAEYTALPDPFDNSQNAHFISAVNHSDDVKMLFRKQVEGLEANTTYYLQTTVRFATNAPADCPGIGGPIGNAVRVITSASTVMPEQFEDDDYYRLNLQYDRDDPQEWYQNSIIGHIGNTRDCDEDYVYEMKEVSSENNHDQVITDNEGRAWLMFGTRSGFEGQTDLYYTYFRAELRKVG